jgi:hypothetical protein
VLVGKRLLLTAQRCRRQDVAELLRMGDDLTRARLFGQLDKPFPLLPNGEVGTMVAHLHRAARRGSCRGQAIEHAVEGEITVPAHPSLLSRKALPGKGRRQWPQLLGGEQVTGPLPGGAMHASIAPVTPGQRLVIQAIQVAKVRPRPKPPLDHPDRPLDLPFRLGGIGLADADAQPHRGRKVGKARVPDRRRAIHVHQHTLHPVRQHHLREATKVLTGAHQTADQGRRVAALGELHKAHARIAQHRREAVELVRGPLQLVEKLAPIELQLLPRPCLVPHHRLVTGRAQPVGLHEVLQNGDAAGIALGL